MHSLKRFFIWLAKVITLGFAILSIGLVVISLIRPDWIRIAITWIGELIKILGNWNYLIAFASACIESLPIIGTAVPGMNIMILVGGFWGKLHPIGTIGLAIVGAMIGNYVGYWIGKWYGHEIIDKYGDYIGLGRTEQRILEGQIQRNGFWYIVLGKFHNFTRAFVPFIAGAAGMQERNFWTYNIIGSVFWAASVNILGMLFIDNYETILDNFGKIMTGFIMMILGYFWFFKRESLKSYIHAKNAEIEEKLKKQQHS